MIGRKSPPVATVKVEVAPAGDRAAYLPLKKKRNGASTGFAIQAFVGANGSGKTLAVLELVVLPAWAEGTLVVTNMGLYPEALGYSADLVQPLTSWRDIVKIGTCQEKGQPGGPCAPGDCPHSFTKGRGCVLVLDEASAVLPSRASGSVPHQLIRVLNQLRKRDVQCVWTAPAYQRMDLAVREITQAVTVCTGTFGDRWERVEQPGKRRWFPPKAKDDHGRSIATKRGWRPNRLFTWTTYEAMSYDEFTLGKTQQLRPRARRTYWRSKHDAHHAYRTMEGVEMMDHVDASGACLDCGLPRKRVSCSCSSGPASGRVEAAAGRPEPSPTGTPRRAAASLNGTPAIRTGAR